MNAGERNCYMALREQVERYGFDAAFVALLAVLDEVNFSAQAVRAKRRIEKARLDMQDSGVTLDNQISPPGR